MDELLTKLMAENKRLRDEIITLKARLYDLEHPSMQSSLYEKVFEPFIKVADNLYYVRGSEMNRGNDELVDGF